jgi:hypothetical protein
LHIPSRRNNIPAKIALLTTLIDIRRKKGYPAQGRVRKIRNSDPVDHSVFSAKLQFARHPSRSTSIIHKAEPLSGLNDWFGSL